MAPAAASLGQSSSTVVCVMDASGSLGSNLVHRLLQRGYTVHAALQSHTRGESEPLKELAGANKKLKIFESDPFDYQSIVEALKGCSGLFYSFEPPQDQPAYDEIMAEVEVRVAHNVLEACARTDTIDKVVFTSSATAVIWRDDRCSSSLDFDERHWSDINLCRKFKLWHAVSKTLAEKAADFLNKRQLAWEDAFRSLYYMFRKSMCNIFYVCTAQFVVMFIAGDRTKGSKSAWNAYVSQSTRSLRSLLREQDIHFSMPLCHSQVETINTEDLVELSEMEKHNLGQIRRLSTISDVDNSSQSCLAFIGNENVHGLYDFLLNYRFFLTSMTGLDVPVLYSPVPFQNGALSSPEVRCKEVRRADNISFLLKESNMNEELNKVSSAGFCYSIEIRDAYLPPWVISSVCEAIGSEGMSFDVSFVTESNSSGLNVGLKTICQNFSTYSTEGESLQEGSTSFGIPNTILCPRLSSAFLNGLKYCDGSYTASATPV